MFLNSQLKKKKEHQIKLQLNVLITHLFEQQQDNILCV